MNIWVRDKWRFICVDCGSTAIIKRYGEKGREMGRFSHFKCDNCGSKAQTVYDKKQGIEVANNEIKRYV